jgi:hypothetical protein
LTPILARSDWAAWAIEVETVESGRYSMVRVMFLTPAEASICLALDALYGYGL